MCSRPFAPRWRRCVAGRVWILWSEGLGRSECSAANLEQYLVKEERYTR